MNTQTLPQPSADALTHSQQLQQRICDHIDTHGPMPFHEYMKQALYTPGLGYYSAGATKFGRAGDFITGPELTPLYGQAIATQYQDLTQNMSHHDVLELGAGTGALAISLLQSLQKADALPDTYYILEVSADCRQRQQTRIQAEAPDLFPKVVWLDTLPSSSISGMVIANEVLDAMPVHKFQVSVSGIAEYAVTHASQQLQWQLAPSRNLNLIKQVSALQLPGNPPYCSELNPSLPTWIHSLSDSLRQGMILIIDYGFPEPVYYHPQRHMGTLMCHFQHTAHDDPLIYPGIQDITAHVNFTAIAEAASNCDLCVKGYTHQAAFLTACHIQQFIDQSNPTAFHRDRHHVQLLTHPNEMGELFKVIALSRDIEPPLVGFSLINQLEKL